MIAVPTTTVSVFGISPTAVDEFNDPVVDDFPTAIGVAASIIEQSKRVATATSDRLQVIRSYTARLPADMDVPAGSRLVDEQSEVVYLVDATSQPANPYTTTDVRCDLRRVD